MIINNKGNNDNARKPVKLKNYYDYDNTEPEKVIT